MMSALHSPFIVLLNAVLLIELIDTSVGSCALLLSCVERVALGTDFYVNVFLGRTCYESIAAVTGYGCLMICGMYSFLHFFTSLCLLILSDT